MAKTYDDHGGPNPSDNLADCTDRGLMSGGLPGATLRDLRREREGTSTHLRGMAQHEGDYRQRAAGNRKKRS